MSGRHALFAVVPKCGPARRVGQGENPHLTGGSPRRTLPAEQAREVIGTRPAQPGTEVNRVPGVGSVPANILPKGSQIVCDVWEMVEGYMTIIVRACDNRRRLNA